MLWNIRKTKYFTKMQPGNFLCILQKKVVSLIYNKFLINYFILKHFVLKMMLILSNKMLINKISHFRKLFRRKMLFKKSKNYVLNRR